MNDDSVMNVAQFCELSKLIKDANFKSNDKKETYQWVGNTLGKFRYSSEIKKNKVL